MKAGILAMNFSLRDVRENGWFRHEATLSEEDFQEALAQTASLRGPITLELTLELSDGMVNLGGSLRGRWDLACSRCLTPRPSDFSAPLEGSFGPETDSVDAAEEIRQALLLAVPFQSLCASQCRGLCPRCGTNLNLGECPAHA